jgi:hypothetical protein
LSIFFIIGAEIDFCLELGGFMLLMFVVDDLLKKEAAINLKILSVYIISLLLVLLAFLINDSIRGIIIHIIFTLLVGADVIIYKKRKSQFS